MEELCRWKKSEEDVPYPWSECWTWSFPSPLTDALQLEADTGLALLVQQPLQGQRVSDLTRGPPNHFTVDFPSRATSLG